MRLQTFTLFKLISISFLIFFSQTLTAAKVKLEPSNWGKEEGKACIQCHDKSSKGLTAQWKHSAHATAGVNCFDCHQANEDDQDAYEHEGSIIATIVSPKDCGRCHTTEYKEQKGSVHAQAVLKFKTYQEEGPAHFGMTTVGDKSCKQCHGTKVKVRGDGRLDSSTWPNFGIGRINPDGSLGTCAACHGRHEFSKARAREPGACTVCHSGTESPDKLVYETSKHGMLFTAHKDLMNLKSDNWNVGKDYSAAPTCVTCHMGAAGKMKSNHDVGMRESWNLNKPVSSQQYLVIFDDGDKRELSENTTIPRRGDTINKLDGKAAKVKAVASPKRRRGAMMKTCLECHSKSFANNSLDRFDQFVKDYNKNFAGPAKAIMDQLYAEKLLSSAPFDESLERTYWKMWHHNGTHARHAAAMSSPAQALSGLTDVAELFYGDFMTELKAVAGEKRAQALLNEHVFNLQKHQWLLQTSEPEPEPKSETEIAESDVLENETGKQDENQ
jgi:hypothetical protein